MIALGERFAEMSPLQVALAVQQLEPRLGILGAEPLAIVGMGCRFPGANNPDEFWRLLVEGREVNSEVPADRWDIDALYDADPKAPGKMYARRAAFLTRIDQFDPHFFGISPREARVMDPQQRMLLEVTWEALESANQPPSRLTGSPTGVFVGMCTYDFSYWLHELTDPASIDLYYSTGCAPSVAAGRLSFALGLTGPSMTVDTACSSALVAVHLACQSLRARECNVAVAGGVSLMASPELSIAFCKAGMLSRDGRCRTFDESADGYGRGEGCGMVVLKRLADASADGDDVIAVIRGSAVNQDGPSGGLTVPSGPAQQAVIRRALESSGVLPSQVSYVEAHGTATRLGDPIEVNAIGAVLGAGRTLQDNPLYVGSVKTNIGHLEAAAGVASLMKVALALRHQVIPAHLHFDNPTPFIDWGKLPCVVPTGNSPWPGSRRIAGVSSFGYSGTNAHALLEAAPALEAKADGEVDRPVHLLVLSAKTSEARVEVARQYVAYLDSGPSARLADICHTAAVGRSHFPYRLALNASSVAQMRERLAGWTPDQGEVTASLDRGVGFLFTGDAPADNVGRELYATHPGFRTSIDRCAQVLGRSSTSLLEAGDSSALFALEYSLAELWRSWGVKPRSVWGQGVGGVVAECVSGAMTLEDGLRRISHGDLTTRGATAATTGQEAVERMRQDGCDEFVEVDPGAGVFAWEELLGKLGELYTRGVDVDWRGFDRYYPRRRVALPTYPFQRQRYWPGELRDRSRLGMQRQPKPTHPLLGARVHSAALGARQVLFESRLTPEQPAFLYDHRVFGQAVLPAAAFLEIALAAGATLFQTSNLVLEDVAIAQPLILPDGQECQLQTLCDGNEFRIFSLAVPQGNAEWKLHALGKVRPMEPTTPPATYQGGLSGVAVPIETLYRRFADRGLEYGPAFRGLVEVRRDDQGTSGRVRLPDGAREETRFYLHPALLDSCFQTMGPLFEDRPNTYLPVGFDRLRLYRSPADETVGCRASIDGSDALLNGTLRIFDAAGAPVADLDGVAIQRTDRAAVLRKLNQAPGDWFYEVAWRQKAPSDRKRGGSRQWLVVHTSSEIGAELARALDARGDLARLASPAEACRLIQRGLQVDGCVYAASADAFTVCTEVLDLVQAMAGADGGRLVLVTTGAQQVRIAPESIDAQQAALWGLGRVIPAEGLGIGALRLDLDPEADRDEQIACVLQELDAADAEDQVAYRNQSRYVARLSRRGPVARIDGPVRLQISTPGTFENLQLVTMKRCQPGVGELEIEVRASGLNFRDVLHALGMLARTADAIESAEKLTFGFECAGVVSAVGAGVRDFAVGQPVMGLAPGGMSSFVTVPATHVAVKPTRLSFEQAAAVPLVCLTAMYGLEKLAHIQAGDRVLIHSAAGGVGQAALQVARRAGAEVFATASRGKWQRLAAQGVQHVLDSRSLDFADEILRLTDGEGVDVVLNSLNGKYIDQSLRTLKYGGRFVELGKIGIWSAEEMRALRPDVAYFPFDLGLVAASEPELIATMMRELVDAFEVGALQPLAVEVFPVAAAADAFRHMAQARHYGKIVLAGAPRSADALIRPDATYLITGGAGALGMEIARWMVAEGARRLVLVSRHIESDSRISELGAGEVEVLTCAANVALPGDVTRVLALAHTDARPLRGIVHAAGVLEDCALVNATAERFQRVMAPKVDGAWNLHSLTRDLPLDFFVCFSSASALLGTPGQGAYAAANAFMDALAHHRRGQGLPALSVNWGPWAGVGMAARMDDSHRNRMLQQGFQSIDPLYGVSALRELLCDDAVQMAVLPIAWDRVLGHVPAGSEPPFYSELASEVREREVRDAQPAKRDHLLSELSQASAETRRDLVSRFLEEHVRRVLGIGNSDRLNPDEPLAQMGLDSLMGIELKSRVGTELGIDIPLQKFVGASSLTGLASLLLEQLTLASLSSTALDESEEMEEIAL